MGQEQKAGGDGRVAIVTGGGRGLGKAMARALAARGAIVAILDRDGETARDAAAEIGAGALARAVDVADDQAVRDSIDAIAHQHGGIDLLINNAGIHGAEADRFFGDLGIAASKRMFDVNVWGVVHCTLAARPHMAGRANASIVNIASMAAYGSVKAYGVSKLAVRGLTASFAHELAPDGIRVNAIAPGLILTDTIRAELDPAVVARVTAGQILRREGEERDIVEAMLWLTSDGAGFVTGETLRVSGGATLQV